MEKPHILIIEDEEDLRELVRYNLEREQFTVTEAGSGEEGLRTALKKKPDLILLDLMLPGKDGLQICRELKRSDDTASIPVVMMTAKSEESDIIIGLELGADDYVIKPFSPKILIARVRAVLRRSAEPAEPSPESVIKIHSIVIHPGRHEVTVRGTPVDLTATEFRMIHFLARRPGWVFTRYQIVDAVHGEDYPVTERSIDVQIVGLRRKLGSAGDLIETVRGIGYRFKDAE